MGSLHKDTIRQVAFQTTGQRDNHRWHEVRKGKLTASNFAKAISAINNPHPSNIQRVRDEIYFPKDLSNIPAIKWGTEHEAGAIDAYVRENRVIVKPSGLWLYANGFMGASPDGLVFEREWDRDPVGIVEVKCPYSMRDVRINSEAEWTKHLKYIDCQNRLLPSHPYYHQVQGTMHAVGVYWCDFYVWTPHNTLTIRIGRDPHWAQQYLGKLELFYKQHLRRPEDVGTMEWDADSAEEDGADYMFARFEEPTKDLNAILHPIGGAQQELRYFVIQAMQLHLARHIHRCLSSSRSGMRWSESVQQYWSQALQMFCESCARALFSKLWYKQVRPERRLEVADIVQEILRDENVWSSLLYDPDFARLVRIRVRAYEPAYGNKTPACTCRIKKVNGEVKHIDDQYAFSPEPVFIFIRVCLFFIRAST